MSQHQDKQQGDDELELVQRAQQGDAAAFGIIYERHLEAFYRYIFFRTGNEADAEDLTEEVFVKAWEALPRYKQGKYPFTAWLYRIAHNLVVDYHRKHKPVAMADPQEVQRVNTENRIEDAFDFKQDMSQLAQAVQQLKDEEQQVLILRFVEELSHREIAKVIGKSEGASRIIQHRALGNLRDILDEMIGDE